MVLKVHTNVFYLLDLCYKFYNLYLINLIEINNIYV